MAQYSKDKNYDDIKFINAQRKEFECPCCGKHILISDAELEKFELSREFTLFPTSGYIVHYGGYRLCKKCHRRRERSFDIPLKIGKYGLILAVISIIVASVIDWVKYGSMMLGFWLLIATPLWILAWLIPNLIWFKASSFRTFDFDKNLSKNAVDWNPRFKKGKK